MVNKFCNKGETKMRNENCPYKAHCHSYRFDSCEGCNENVIRTSNNSLSGVKSNIDVPSAYPDMVRLARSNIDEVNAYTSPEFHEFIRNVVNKPMGLDSKPKEPEYPKIKNVKISGPCTIIFWEDGTKTVMRCSKIDENHFDPEKAILLAFYRKVTGFSKTHSQKELDKLTNEAYDNIFIESVKE